LKYILKVIDPTLYVGKCEDAVKQWLILRFDGHSTVVQIAVVD